MRLPEVDDRLPDGFCRFGGMRPPGRRQNHGELLSAVAGREAPVKRGRGRDGFRDAAQGNVARPMPVRVVVGLEVVDIDHQKADRTLATVAGSTLAIEDGLESTAVHQPGKVVGRGEFLKPRLGVNPVIDLPFGEDEKQCDPGRESGQQDADLGGARPEGA